MASVTRPRSRQLKRRAGIEAAVLAATERLLADGANFTELGVQRIVAEAGVARSSFYMCFPDKVTVLVRLVGNMKDELFGKAGMTDDQADGFSTGFRTAYAGLVERAPVQAGQTLLVLGAAGSSGAAALQLGKALGATVIAVAGSEDKLEFCRRYGADHAVNQRTDDLTARITEITDGRGVDLIYAGREGQVRANPQWSADRCGPARDECWPGTGSPGEKAGGSHWEDLPGLDPGHISQVLNLANTDSGTYSSAENAPADTCRIGPDSRDPQKARLGQRTLNCSKQPC